MSATLSSTEQKVYNKVMASKKKAMTLAQIEAAIPGLSKKEMNSSINNILRLKLFTAAKGKDDVLVFHAVAVEDAKRQNTLTEEQQYVLGIIDKAGNKGISRPGIANQVSTELMARSQVFKALEALEKNQLVKTFKSVNAPTMPLYILAHLTPPEDIAGGIWFDESKEYDSVFVDSLRMVVYKYVQHKTFPAQKAKDSISALCPNPIFPVSKTPSLPAPQELLGHIQKNKVTTAKLTVKNVMEICRALELDGLIEAIKPIGGVSVEPIYDSDSDFEPVPKRRKHLSDDEDLDPKERERRERKEREKLKAKIKEKKREQRRRERARERDKERERKKKEKEKERKRKEKERERKRKEKERERKRKEKEKKKKKRAIESDADDSDDELREIDEDDLKAVKSKRKRRVDSDASGSDSDSDSGSDSDSSSSSSDSDSDSEDSDVSSVMSDDIHDRDVTRSGGTMGISSNPFFSADGRQTLIDLSDQAVVYRAVRRLAIPLGQNQAPCGTCPQFNFCEQDGPVNPDGCQYITDWLAGTEGGWTADVKAEKAKKAAEEEKARRKAAAEAAGEEYVENPEGDELEDGLEAMVDDDKEDVDMEW